MRNRLEGVRSAMGRLLAAAALGLGAAPAAWALDVTVTATNDPAPPGGLAYYRIVVANRDGVDRSNVVVTAEIPTGASLRRSVALPVATCPFLVGSGAVCSPSEDASWTFLSIPAGGSVVVEAPFDVDSTAADGTDLALNVSVTFGGASGPDTATRSVTVDATPPLLLGIGARRQLVGPDEDLRFDVSFGNTSTSSVSGVELRSSLPAGTSFVSASDGGVLDDGGTPADASDDAVVWDLSAGPIIPGASSKRTFTVSVPAGVADGTVLVAEAQLNSGGPSLTRASDAVVVRDGVDLTLDVTVIGDATQPSEFIYYQYTVANRGLVPVSDVTLRALMARFTQLRPAVALPAATCPFVSGDSRDCREDEWINWDLGTLGAGESRVVIAPVDAFSDTPDGRPLMSHAQVTQSTGPFVLGTRPTVLADSDAPLRLAVSPSKRTVGPEDEFRYELSFGNVSTASVSGVELRSSLPAGTGFVSASDGGVLDDGGTPADASDDAVVWDLSAGPIIPGASSKRTFTVSVPAGVADGTVLVAEAQLNSGGPSLTRASDAVVVRDGVDLTLDVTVIGDATQPSEFIYYQYTVANRGLVPVSDVTLRALMARFTQLRPAVALPAATCPFVSGDSRDCREDEWINWDLGTLGAGESRVVIAPVDAFSDTPDGRPLMSHAQVTQSTGPFVLGTRPTVLADSDAPLRLAVSPSKRTVGPEDEFRYELSFGNVSTASVSGVELRSSLPAGTGFVSASDGGVLDDGGTPADASDDAVVWDLSAVPIIPGQSSKRTFTLSVPAGVADGTVLVTEAQLNSGGPSLTRASDAVVVRDGVDLTLDVTVIGDATQPSEFIYYQYTVANRGLVPVSDVTLRALMARFTQLRPAVALPAATCPFVSGDSRDCREDEWINWDLGTLGAGESRVVIAPVDAFSDTPDGRPLMSHAQVTQSTGPFVLGTRPTVLSEPDAPLRLVAEADEPVVTPGGTRTLTLSVGNVGTATVSDVVLSAALPPGATFVSATDGGFVKDGEVIWPLGNVPANSSASTQLTLEAAASLVNGEVLTLQTELRDGTGGGSVARAGTTLLVESGPRLRLLADADDFTTPGEIAYALDVTNNNGSLIADGSLSLLVPPFSSTPNPADGSCPSLTGSSATCFSDEWVTWALGTLNPTDTASRSALATIFTGASAPADGDLLVANVRVTDTTAPRRELALVRTTRVGASFSPDPNHDSDGDGMTDSFEIRFGLNRLGPLDAALDSDGDGFTNLEEHDASPQTDPTDPASFPVTPNLPPVANAVTDPAGTVVEGRTVTLDGAGSSDPDDAFATLTFQWTQNAADAVTVTLADATAPTTTFTAPDVPAGAAEMVLNFTLQVSDPGGASNTANVSITVVPDQPPTADAGPDQTQAPGAAVTLNGSNSSDPEDPIGSFFWEQIDASGLTVTLSDPNVAQPTFTAPDPAPAASAALEFRLTVTDSRGQTGTDTVIVNVTTVPQPPTASAGPDQTVFATDTVTLDGTNSSDTDGTVDGFQWTQPAGTVVTLTGADTATATFTAPAPAGGGSETLTFQLEVTDSDGLMDTDTVDVLINPAPIPLCNAGMDTSVDEGATVALDGSSSSVSDGAITGFQWSQEDSTGIPVTIADPTAEVTSFTAPDVGGEGASLRLRLTCTTDRGATASDEKIVTVGDVDPPSANAGADQAVAEGTAGVVLDGSGSSDPDGDVLSPSWSQSAGPGVTLSDPNVLQPTFTAPDVGEAGAALTFILTVTDPGGLQSDDSVTVNVTNVNLPPVADAGADQSVEEGSTVTLDGSASSDPDAGDTLAFEWRQASGPGVSLSDSSSASPTFTAPDVDADTDLVFELTVRDRPAPDGLTAGDQVSVTVTPAADEDDDGGSGSSGPWLLGLLALAGLARLTRRRAVVG